MGVLCTENLKTEGLHPEHRSYEKFSVTEPPFYMCVGASIHELDIQYCIIVYSTGLRDKQKTAWHPRASCSINCVLPTGKSVMYEFLGFFFYMDLHSLRNKLICIN